MVIEQPTTQDVTLWRYLSIEKFIDFLRGRTLYLRRVDLLEDMFEATLSKPTLDFLEAQAREFMREINSDQKFGGAELGRRINQILRYRSYINCWNESEYESPALWKIYVPEGRGIAIRTKSSWLKQAIGSDAVLSKVKYVDYSKEVFASKLDDDAVFYKRVQFSYENEWRVVKQLSPLASAPQNCADGIEISVQTLNFEVILPPSCPELTAKTIFAVMTAFKCMEKWHQSSFDDLPA